MVPKNTTSFETFERSPVAGIHFPHSYQLTLDGQAEGLLYSKPKPVVKDIDKIDPNQETMLVPDGYKPYARPNGEPTVVRQLFVPRPDFLDC